MITRTKTAAAACLLLALLIMTACTDRSKTIPGADGKIIVVATILPLSDWAANIGGDRVFVTTLIPAGASPHTFDPTPRDMRLISHARLFLKVGLNMDNWGASLAKSAGEDGPAIISIGDLLLKQNQIPAINHHSPMTLETVSDGHEHDSHDHDHDHEHGSVNPHFWLDPQLAIKSVNIIRDQLTRVDPDGKAVYSANADTYIKQLEQLDQEYKTTLQPYAGSQFVTFHNAWPYMAQRYGLDIAAVIEEYPGKTPSEKYLRSVTDQLKKLGIHTIFTEPQLNPRVADLIASEVGGSVSLLDPYGTADQSDRNTYIKVMKFNLTQLVKAFSVDVKKTAP